MKIINYGNLYVEVPDDHILARQADPATHQTEQPAVPAAPELVPHVYQPNDPFQSGIDQVVALSNVSKVNKPWVRKAFLLLFVIIPVGVIELGLIEVVYSDPGVETFLFVLGVNMLALVGASPYLAIWSRARRNARRG